PRIYGIVEPLDLVVRQDPDGDEATADQEDYSPEGYTGQADRADDRGECATEDQKRTTCYRQHRADHGRPAQELLLSRLQLVEPVRQCGQAVDDLLQRGEQRCSRFDLERLPLVLHLLVA